MALTMVEDDDEPFLINAASRSTAIQRSTLQGRDEAKIEVNEATLNEERNDRLHKQRHNLRRRLRRRNNSNNEENKVEDEKETTRNDLDASASNPAGEESKESEISSPNQSFRVHESPPVAQPSTAADASNNPQRLPMPMMHHSNYIRRPPDQRLKDKFKNKLRSVADGIPEVHFIGEVVEGCGFKDTFVSCKW